MRNVLCQPRVAVRIEYHLQSAHLILAPFTDLKTRTNTRRFRKWRYITKRHL